MARSFGQFAIEQSGEFKDPDNPQQTHTFDEPARLAYCMDLLLPTAEGHPTLEDLPRRLAQSAKALNEDFISSEDARRAVRELAEGFENYLQLIALTKYSHRRDLLFGEEGVHEGIMSASLGDLLHGSPRVNPDASVADDQVPTVQIVTYDPSSKQRRDRIYREAKRIRNEVHAARKQSLVEILQEANVVLAAYLFATEESTNAIANKLYKHVDYLRELRQHLQDDLPYVVDPEIQRMESAGHASTDTEENDREYLSRWGLDELHAAVVEQDATRFAIYGDPGSGKTTLVRALANRVAAEKRREPLSNLPIPVVVEANRYTGEDFLATMVATELGVNAQDLATFTGVNRLLVCIDGINEIQSRHLRKAIAEIQNLSSRLPQSSFLLTSRFEHLFQTLEFDSFVIAPFDNQRIRNFLDNEFEDGDKAESFFEELKRHPRLLDLCRNPLLLYMLTDISSESVRIPPNRGKLLHEFMTRFLDREAPQIAPIEPSTLRLLLSELAFEMRRQTVVSLPVVTVEHFVKDQLAELQANVGAGDLLSAIRGAKLLHDVRGDRLAFFHELIQEYFAALELLKQFRADKIDIGELAEDRWWQEVLILAFGLSDDEDALYEALQESSLSLVAKSVMDGPLPDPTRQDQVVSRASKVLDDDDMGQAQALEALAAVWNEEALKRVARALQSKQEVLDFVARFTDDPYGAAVDLLEVAPSPVVLSGIRQALERTTSTGSADQLHQLFRISCRMIVQKADGEWPRLSYEQMLELALLGRMAPDDEHLGRRATQTFLEIGHPLKADKLAARHQLTGTDSALDFRLARELIISRVSPGGTNSAEDFSVTDSDRRTLVGLALLEGVYNWAGLLADPDDTSGWLTPLRTSLSERILRSRGGNRAGQVLEQLWGAEVARGTLRKRLIDFEVPPDQAAAVAKWLGEPSLLRQRLTDYVQLARRQRLPPRSFSKLGRLAKVGDLDPELGRELVEFFDREGEIEPALYLIHAAGLSSDFRDVVETAEEEFDPENAVTSSPWWQDLVLGKCWTWWSPGFQSTVLEHVIREAQDLTHELWSPEARESLATILLQRLERLDSAVRPGVCRIAGIVEEARTTLQQQLPRALSEGNTAIALDLMAAWDLKSTDLSLSAEQLESSKAAARRRVEQLVHAGKVRAGLTILEQWEFQPKEVLSGILDLYSGEGSAEVVCAGYEQNVFSQPEAEGWFIQRLRSGDIGEALSVNRSRTLSRDLRGTAILAVLEMIEAERFKEAGQLIAAFDLQEEFHPKLESLIPHLIDAGKPGVAQQLSERLGADHTAALGELVVDVAVQQIRSGSIGKALGLVNDAGVSFIRREFRQRLADYMRTCLETGDRGNLRDLLSDDRTWPFLRDESLLLEALEFSQASVPATVDRLVSEKGYGFASLPASRLEVFFHANDLVGDFDALEHGSNMLVRVARDAKGPKADWAQPVDSAGDHPEDEEPSDFHEGEGDGASVEKLKEAWAARLRELE